MFVCTPSQFLVGLVSMCLLFPCYACPQSFEDGHVAFGSSKVVSGHLTHARTQKNHKALGFLSNTGQDPQKNHKATKPVFNVGPLNGVSLTSR